MTARGRATVVNAAAPKRRDSPSPESEDSRVPPPSSTSRRYFEQLHVPMIVVLSFFVVSIGAIGFGLRPGRSIPPPVLNPSIVIRVQPADDSGAAVTAISVEETLYQLDAKTVALEIAIFGK